MDATEFINALGDGKKLYNAKANQIIYVSIIGIEEITNFITLTGITTFRSDAYGISPINEKKVDIFYKNEKMMTIEPDNFEVYRS